MAPRVFNILAALAYIAWIAAIMWLAFHGRRVTLDNLNTPEARAQWKQWREAAKSLNEHGPVQRRVPKSLEPPALVLMRDYFGVVVTAGGLFGSLLFAAVVWPLRGVLLAKPAASRASRS